MSEYNRRMPFVKLFQVKLFNVLVRSGFNGLGDRSTLPLVLAIGGLSGSN